MLGVIVGVGREILNLVSIVGCEVNGFHQRGKEEEEG